MATSAIMILWHFLVGMLGAFTFLFLLLLFDKDVAILENALIPKAPMVILYVVLGGVLAVVMTIPSSADVGVSQLRVAFGTGLSWPALATGIGAGRRMGELGLEIGRKKEANLAFEGMIGKAKDEASEYFKTRLERADELLKIALERAEREKQEIHDFYTRRITERGGN